MSLTFPLEILAADNAFYQGQCRSLIIPTVDGMYGIQANHENEIIAVSIGLAKYTDESGEQFEAVLSSGICKVENGRVLILVETAEHPEEIDRVHAERDAAEAAEALRSRTNTADIKRAKAKMARAISRLRAKEKTEID